MIKTDDFWTTLWGYYDNHARDLPWRHTTNPYHILVSEIMLQQTQVSRVVPKYQIFLKQFPSYQILAEASLADVLRVWSGLGYNRRAKYLWQAGQQLNKLEEFPQNRQQLIELSGVGTNTAGAVLVYAFNQPAIFIETNIRSVTIHHFFADDIGVTDRQITEVLQLLFNSLQRQPREFYWALMDYGTYLKTTQPNPSRRSKQYVKQSTFQGSKRQIRGQVLKTLAGKKQTERQLRVVIDDERLNGVLTDLVNEKLITKQQSTYQLYVR